MELKCERNFVTQTKWHRCDQILKGSKLEQAVKILNKTFLTLLASFCYVDFNSLVKILYLIRITSLAKENQVESEFNLNTCIELWIFGRLFCTIFDIWNFKITHLTQLPGTKILGTDSSVPYPSMLNLEKHFYCIINFHYKWYFYFFLKFLTYPICRFFMTQNTSISWVLSRNRGFTNRRMHCIVFFMMLRSIRIRSFFTYYCNRGPLIFK